MRIKQVFGFSVVHESRSVFLRKITQALGNKASLAFSPVSRVFHVRNGVRNAIKTSLSTYRLALCFDYSGPRLFMVVYVIIYLFLLAKLKLAAYHYSFMTCP